MCTPEMALLITDKLNGNSELPPLTAAVLRSEGTRSAARLLAQKTAESSRCDLPCPSGGPAKPRRHGSEGTGRHR